MAATGPISRDELAEMFGDELPIEAVRLVWEAPPEKTVGQVRADLRALALTLRHADPRDAEIARLTAALANTQADFAALQRALVGNTGASAIETAAKQRRKAPRGGRGVGTICG